MKKLIVAFVLISCFVLKSHTAAAQLTYDEGYIAGYQFAMDKLKIASDAHPEWALVLRENEVPMMDAVITTYTVVEDDYQRKMLAVNSVMGDYLGYITTMKDTDVAWYGYFMGFQQATADFEIGD